MSNRKLYSYVMTHDSGFAPNPFFGYLTLATCMADIRRTKSVGDWVAGFAGKTLVRKCRALDVPILHHGLIYLMQIDEIRSLDEYFHDPRFQQKKAIPLGTNDITMERGDNIYQSDGMGNFSQLENDNHDEGELLKDTKGKNVLIAKQFYYFGRNCPVPAATWRSMNVRVPDRYICLGCKSDGPALDQMVGFLQAQGYRPGVNGTPCIWKVD